MDLSVVIVNWNTRDLLRACLDSLRAAAAGTAGRVEVIVVDNASGDGSAAMVRESFPEVRLIPNTENRNYAAGSNQGLEAASGEFLLLLNADTEVPVGALTALAACLRERPSAGAVAPALVHPDGRLQASVRGFPTPVALFGEVTGLARLLPRSALGAYRPRALPQDRPVPVDQPMASALLIRRSALEQVGPLDEEYPLFFNDVDLCYRLKRAGWEVLYDPRVRIVHHGGASTRLVRREAVRRSHEALLLFYRRHYRGRLPRPVYALATAAIRCAGWCRAIAAPAGAPAEGIAPARRTKQGRA